MQSEERRITILERNKAAALRYRKRKKEEHDDMIIRVKELEKKNNLLQSQNVVLISEIERLNALIKMQNSNCFCCTNKNNPMSIANDNADIYKPSNFSSILSEQKKQ